MVLSNRPTDGNRFVELDSHTQGTESQTARQFFPMLTPYVTVQMTHNALTHISNGMYVIAGTVISWGECCTEWPTREV